MLGGTDPARGVAEVWAEAGSSAAGGGSLEFCGRAGDPSGGPWGSWKTWRSRCLRSRDLRRTSSSAFWRSLKGGLGVAWKRLGLASLHPRACSAPADSSH